jgi:class 3 adenylate cyclase
MTDIGDFARDVFAVAPSLREAMTARGDDALPDPDLPTLWMGDLGGAVVSSFAELRPDELRAVFETAERHLATASQRMRNAICTGFLEVFASAVSGGRLSGESLAELLGPESRAYLDAWDQFSLGRSSLDPT